MYNKDCWLIFVNRRYLVLSRKENIFLYIFSPLRNFVNFSVKIVNG